MSLLKANTIKPVTSGADLSLQGDSGGSAVDCLNITSAGDVDFSGNADAKIKLPSAGGIYESDGTTPVLTESGGVVTLGSSVVFPAGHVIKLWHTSDGDGASSANRMYHDNTIPQISEGFEVMTLAVTPTSATNKLIINVNTYQAFSVAMSQNIAALFQDSTANALAVQAFRGTSQANSDQSIAFTHVMVAGTTSSTTFRVRIGSSGTGTTYFNGAGSPLFGGSLSSSIVIQEVVV